MSYDVLHRRRRRRLDDARPRRDTAKYAAYFRGMLERGFTIAPSQFEACFVSLAHTDEDIDASSGRRRGARRSSRHCRPPFRPGLAHAQWPLARRRPGQSLHEGTRMKAIIPAAGWGPGSCPSPRPSPRRCCRSSTSRSSSTWSRRPSPPASTDIIRHRPRQARDRGPLRPLRRARGRCSRRRASRGARHRPRDLRLAEVFYVRQKEPQRPWPRRACAARRSSTTSRSWSCSATCSCPTATSCRGCARSTSAPARRHRGHAGPRTSEVSRYGVIAGEDGRATGVWRVTGSSRSRRRDEAPSTWHLRPLPADPGGHGDAHRDAPGRGRRDPAHRRARGAARARGDLRRRRSRTEGYDTGNVLAWLEANVAIALQREEYAGPLRESLARLLGLS